MDHNIHSKYSNFYFLLFNLVISNLALKNKFLLACLIFYCSFGQRRWIGRSVTASDRNDMWNFFWSFTSEFKSRWAHVSFSSDQGRLDKVKIPHWVQWYQLYSLPHLRTANLMQKKMLSIGWCRYYLISYLKIREYWTTFTYDNAPPWCRFVLLMVLLLQ